MPHVDELQRNAPDYRLVQREVDRVLRENACIDPPILPKEIADNYNISVLFATFPERLSHVMGFYDFEKDQILVNKADPVNRQTFTIAHELGHGVLHKDYFRNNPAKYKVLLRRPMGEQKDPLEQEANSFAANLLVPRKMLEKYSRFSSVRELSTLFIVSEEVIRWRLIGEKLVHEYAGSN
jgi:Zn-dependent peptidase ImmA (M78 family)